VPDVVHPASEVIERYFRGTPVLAVGSGEHGAIFELDTTRNDIADAVRSMLRHVTNRVECDGTSSDAWTRRSSVVLKISAMFPKVHKPVRWPPASEPQRAFRRMEIAAAEAVNLCYIGGSSAHDVAPTLYVAGFLEDLGVYVILMEKLRGVPLRDYEKDATRKPKGKIEADIAAEVEYACVRLAQAGIEHADAHSRNFIVDERSRRVRALDFGMSTILPPSIHRATRNAIANAVRTLCETGAWPDPDRIWKRKLPSGQTNEDSIERMMNSLITQYGLQWYNPSSKFVKYVRAHAVGDLNEARRRVWNARCVRKDWLGEELWELNRQREDEQRRRREDEQRRRREDEERRRRREDEERRRRREDEERRRRQREDNRESGEIDFREIARQEIESRKRPRPGENLRNFLVRRKRAR